MRLHKSWLNALLAIGLTTGVGAAQTASGTAPAQSSQPAKRSGSTADDTTSLVGQSDRKFMTEAAQGGMAEVQLAQLAQQKASSSEVKELAKKIEQDHANANTELKKVAEEKKVDLPSDIGAKHQALLQKLQGLSGEQFDKAYTRAMVRDHKKDIKEFQRQSEQGMDSDVKAFASSTLPHLQEHLQLAEQAAGKKSTGTRSRSEDRMQGTGSTSGNADRGGRQDTKGQSNPTPQP